MKESDFYQRFEKLIEQLFSAFNLRINMARFGRDWGVDQILIDNKIKTYCQVKFYRSKNTSNATIQSACEQLAYYVQQKKDGSGLLIVSSFVPRKFKEELKEAYKVVVWDRSDLHQLLQQGLPKSNLLSDFEKLLIEAQQGIDTAEVFQDVEQTNQTPDAYFAELDFVLASSTVKQPSKKGYQLCKELDAIKEDKEGGHDFELKCEEILKYLFSEDLSVWDRQSITNDEFSCLDLVCRIASKDDFWNTLVQSFRSRYILFEFENSSEQIDENQVHAAESRLFTHALRSVLILIARNGANEQAITASKGTLREQGKLILMLSKHDLCKMLEIKDHAGMPNDYLSQLLDDYLISLSR
jgi:hypothetical protein